ncbi:hypothetical protein [Caulobacter sp. DWR2-3-1b2]|uniref:hypothetical protein n=1 Tax=unclassified Caulobacter TaxID=2648921 RepID=UPI003CF61380
MADEFDFDDEAKTVTFKGARLHLLLGLIQRAKFGDRHDRLLLLSEWIADLSTRITGALGLQQPAPQVGVADELTIFDNNLVLAIRDAIIAEAATIGWWTKTAEERRRYLREVVAAPVGMTDRDIERIEGAIEAWIIHARLALAAMVATN